MIQRLLALSILLFPAAAMAQQPPADAPRTLTVAGTGTVERDPERALLMLAVESEAPTARDASQANAELMQAVVAAIRGTGIPERDIRTVSYQLNPVYSRPPTDGGTPRIGAYRAMNMVQVTVDSIPVLGRVVDVSIAAGANRVASLSFELRDYESARSAALELAVRNARAEAEAVAAASDQRLGEPLSISTSTMQPMPYAMPRAMEMAAGHVAADTPIEAGSLTVRATVNIVYKLEPR